MTALICVLSAVISALVSSYPQTAVLKALSLFLLFTYAATGARLAVAGREGKFFNGLLLGCELIAWGSVISYFIFRYPLFGNPNSLGAVVGVVVLPLLLWGTFISQQTNLHRRECGCQPCVHTDEYRHACGDEGAAGEVRPGQMPRQPRRHLRGGLRGIGEMGESERDDGQNGQMSKFPHISLPLICVCNHRAFVDRGTGCEAAFRG